MALGLGTMTGVSTGAKMYPPAPPRQFRTPLGQQRPRKTHSDPEKKNQRGGSHQTKTGCGGGGKDVWKQHPPPPPPPWWQKKRGQSGQSEQANTNTGVTQHHNDHGSKKMRFPRGRRRAEIEQGSGTSKHVLSPPPRDQLMARQKKSPHPPPQKAKNGRTRGNGEAWGC